jgi:hypothetical protein
MSHITGKNLCVQSRYLGIGVAGLIALIMYSMKKVRKTGKFL